MFQRQAGYTAVIHNVVLIRTIASTTVTAIS